MLHEHISQLIDGYSDLQTKFTNPLCTVGEESLQKTIDQPYGIGNHM